MVGPRGGPIKGHREGHCTSRAATVLRMLAHTRPSPRPSPRWLALMPRYTTPRARKAAMREASSPSSASTSSVCWPRAGGACRRTGGWADRRSGLAMPPMCSMPATALDLGVVEGLGDGVDGAAGHGLVLEQLDPVGGAAAARDGLHRGDQVG